jgi:creatinine amidohydrolase
VGGEAMIWDELTTVELDELDRAIPVILPIAATEQHGPHLPLLTDRVICEYFCHAVHERLPEQVLILPVISIGCSEHHMTFAGSLTLTHLTFLASASEILNSVVAHGFNSLVIFNAHGGNQAIGQVILESFGRRHPDAQVVFATWWRVASAKLLEISETTIGGVGHACEFETSLMLHIAPQHVRKALIPPKSNMPTYSWAEADMMRSGQATLYRSMSAMTQNGVFGEPMCASAGKGEAIAKVVIDAVEEIIRSLVSH